MFKWLKRTVFLLQTWISRFPLSLLDSDKGWSGFGPVPSWHHPPPRRTCCKRRAALPHLCVNRTQNSRLAGFKDKLPSAESGRAAVRASSGVQPDSIRRKYLHLQQQLGKFTSAGCRHSLCVRLWVRTLLEFDERFVCVVSDGFGSRNVFSSDSVYEEEFTNSEQFKHKPFLPTRSNRNLSPSALLPWEEICVRY